VLQSPRQPTLFSGSHSPHHTQLTLTEASRTKAAAGIPNPFPTPVLVGLRQILFLRLFGVFTSLFESLCTALFFSSPVFRCVLLYIWIFALFGVEFFIRILDQNAVLRF
jgi:hypothetical protein